MYGLGVYGEFIEHGVGGEEFDIVVIGDLLAELLEDGLAKGVDGLGDLDFDDDLLFVVDEHRFYADEDGLGEVLVGGVDHRVGALQFGLDYVDCLVLEGFLWLGKIGLLALLGLDHLDRLGLDLLLI